MSKITISMHEKRQEALLTKVAMFFPQVTQKCIQSFTDFMKNLNNFLRFNPKSTKPTHIDVCRLTEWHLSIKMCDVTDHVTNRKI